MSQPDNTQHLDSTETISTNLISELQELLTIHRGTLRNVIEAREMRGVDVTRHWDDAGIIALTSKILAIEHILDSKDIGDLHTKLEPIKDPLSENDRIIIRSINNALNAARFYIQYNSSDISVKLNNLYLYNRLFSLKNTHTAILDPYDESGSTIYLSNNATEPPETHTTVFGRVKRFSKGIDMNKFVFSGFASFFDTSLTMYDNKGKPVEVSGVFCPDMARDTVEMARTFKPEFFKGSKFVHDEEGNTFVIGTSINGIRYLFETEIMTRQLAQMESEDRKRIIEDLLDDSY